MDAAIQKVSKNCAKHETVLVSCGSISAISGCKSIVLRVRSPDLQAHPQQCQGAPRFPQQSAVSSYAPLNAYFWARTCILVPTYRTLLFHRFLDPKSQPLHLRLRLFTINTYSLCVLNRLCFPSRNLPRKENHLREELSSLLRSSEPSSPGVPVWTLMP